MKSIAFAVSVCVSFCFADSAVMYEFPDGRTAALISSEEVAMVAESVFITPMGGMFQYRDYEGWLPMMEVRCVFELVNLTDEEQHIVTGFPLDARFGDAYTAMSPEMLMELLEEGDQEERVPWRDISSPGETPLADRVPEDLNFRTLVNGEEVPVHYRACARSIEEGLVWDPLFAMWKMRFLPGETVGLENSYRTSWDYFGGGPGGNYTINYILTTGATWAGSIGEATIILEVPENLPPPCVTDSQTVCWLWSGTPVIQGRTVIWNYRDLDPVENISFTVSAQENLTYWENTIDVDELAESVQWTEEDLLESACVYLADTHVWGIRFGAGTVSRILAAVPRLQSGMEPPEDLPTEQLWWERTGSGVMTEEQKDRAEMAEALVRRVAELESIADEAGYMEFLPLFMINSQRMRDPGMYAAMPEKQERYMELLLALETAIAGEEITNPAVRAFYLLTGWYHP